MDQTEQTTEQHETPEGVAPEVAPNGAVGEDEDSGGSRGWLLVVIIAVLLVYPAARWMLNRSPAAPAATPAAAAQAGASLQESLVHYQAGRYSEAITAAQAVLKVNPNSAEAWNNIAVSFLGLKKYDDALKAAQEALRLNPGMQLAKNNMNWIQQEKINSMRPPLAPETAAKLGMLLNQSLAQTQAKQYQECISTARQATSLDPYSAAALNNLGFCQGALGQWDEGIKTMQQAIALDGTMQLAKNNLAWMQQEKAKAGKK